MILTTIKDDERELRTQDQSHIPNVFVKSDDHFPSARVFKTILCSAVNKKRLQALIKTQLSEISQSVTQELIYSVGEECVGLSSGNNRDDLNFNQCEADIIMLSFYAVLRSSGCSHPVHRCRGH